MLVAAAYFLGARLGLALLTDAEGVAVFWPASGIAAGILIAMGGGVRAPVAIGVVVGTVAANLLGDRSLLASVLKGFCNAGEAMLTAWLIARWFGQPFKLEGPHRVLGFLAAAAIGAAAGAVGGAMTMRLFHTSAPLLSIWHVWFLSDGLGIVTIAPLLIGLGQLTRELPSWRESIEGSLALVVLTVMTLYVFTQPPGSWVTLVPVAVLFPLQLWVAARCPPAFAAVAVFIVAIALVCTTILRVGRFGDAAIPIMDRVIAAQAGMLVTTLCALVLAGLFAERRRHEVELERSNERLQDSKERLQLALSGAEFGAFSLELASGRLECDARAAHIHGHSVPPNNLKEGRCFVHPDDLVRIDTAFAEAQPNGRVWKAEYRVTPSAPGGPQAGKVRWVAFEGSFVRGADGKPVRLLGVTRDITRRKLAEETLRKREQAFRELLGALPAAIYTADAAGHVTYCNQAAIDLWGVRPKPGRDKWCELARFQHTDGTPVALEDCPTQVALKEGRAVLGREGLLVRRDGTRIPVIPCPTPLRDESGAIVGVVDMTVDITERKQAEAALAERNAQLALAGKTALVGSYAFDIPAGIMQVSPGYAAIYGLGERTAEITRGDWRGHVHPEDLPRLDEERSRAFTMRQCEHRSEYRIVRSGGEVRWIESRSFVSYGSDGRACRMVGVNIDVTERKQAEDHKNILIAELDHRVKNALAVVSVIASRTQEASSSMADFVTALDGRIKSMATTHDLLSHRGWQGLPLAELVHRELAPYATASNTRIEGAEIVLSAEAGQAVAMVLHELATNAAKFGALSNSRGLVQVRWSPTGGRRGHRWLAIVWEESGGPNVAPSTRSGYGTSVISDLIPYELGGRVDFLLAPGGARCRLEIPAAWLRNVLEPPGQLLNRSGLAPYPRAEPSAAAGLG